MFHMWWMCLKVRRYWKRVQALIYSMTIMNVIKNPKIALFNEPLEGVPRSNHTLIYCIFVKNCHCGYMEASSIGFGNNETQTIVDNDE